MTSIKNELETISQFYQHGVSVAPLEFLVEELMARTQYATEYKWSHDKLSATVNLISGILICVRSNESGRKVDLEIGWQSTGEHARKSLLKFVPTAVSKACAMLTRAGWQMDSPNAHGQELRLTGHANLSTLRSNFQALVESVDGVAQVFKFD